jgi:hypothetical protein
VREAVAAAAERELEVQTSLVQLKLEDGARRREEAGAAAAAGGRRWEKDERRRQKVWDGGWYQGSAVPV